MHTADFPVRSLVKQDEGTWLRTASGYQATLERQQADHQAKPEEQAGDGQVDNTQAVHEVFHVRSL